MKDKDNDFSHKKQTQSCKKNLICYYFTEKWKYEGCLFDFPFYFQAKTFRASISIYGK